MSFFWSLIVVRVYLCFFRFRYFYWFNWYFYILERSWNLPYDTTIAIQIQYFIKEGSCLVAIEVIPTLVVQDIDCNIVVEAKVLLMYTLGGNNHNGVMHSDVLLASVICCNIIACRMAISTWQWWDLWCRECKYSRVNTCSYAWILKWQIVGLEEFFFVSKR